MRLRETKKYKYRNGQHRKFYGCTKWPKCKATHGAHPDGSPLGHPATAEVKALRRKAHEMIEANYDRRDVWLVIHRLTGLPKEACHIGDMGRTELEQLIKKYEDMDGVYPEPNEIGKEADF